MVQAFLHKQADYTVGVKDEISSLGIFVPYHAVELVRLVNYCKVKAAGSSDLLRRTSKELLAVGFGTTYAR